MALFLRSRGSTCSNTNRINNAGIHDPTTLSHKAVQAVIFGATNIANGIEARNSKTGIAAINITANSLGIWLNILISMTNPPKL